jgi:hypothetical protein
LAYYHFYLMDSGGRTHSAASLQCADDPTAFARAPYELQMTERLPVIEIWHGSRSVGRWALPVLTFPEPMADFDRLDDRFH